MEIKLYEYNFNDLYEVDWIFMARISRLAISSLDCCCKKIAGEARYISCTTFIKYTNKKRHLIFRSNTFQLFPYYMYCERQRTLLQPHQCPSKICIKYRKHGSSSFSHKFNCVCVSLSLISTYSFIQKLPLFIALYHVTFQCGPQGIFKIF